MPSALASDIDGATCDDKRLRSCSSLRVRPNCLLVARSHSSHPHNPIPGKRKLISSLHKPLSPSCRVKANLQLRPKELMTLPVFFSLRFVFCVFFFFTKTLITIPLRSFKTVSQRPPTPNWSQIEEASDWRKAKTSRREHRCCGGGEGGRCR